MKKTISILLIFLFLIILVLNPLLVVPAAADGLRLWYENIFPALLPFAILSDILISSNAFYQISRFLFPLLHMILPCSKSGIFPLAAGFLFGFPMGSRICAQMIQEEKLSREEASIIFIVGNNISPIFIASYIIHTQLGSDALLLPAFLLLYLPPLVYGRLLYHRRLNVALPKETTSELKVNFSILDAGIMNGFEILCKLGGYIMLFSILTALTAAYCPLPGLRTFLTVPLEITNGIDALCKLSMPLRTKFSLVLALTSFGGLCGIVQTNSMVSDVQLPMRKYILSKSILACLTGILSYLLFPFL